MTVKQTEDLPCVTMSKVIPPFVSWLGWRNDRLMTSRAWIETIYPIIKVLLLSSLLKHTKKGDNHYLSHNAWGVCHT